MLGLQRPAPAVPRKPGGSDVLQRLTQFAYHRRRIVVLAWLALLVMAATLGGRFGGDDTTDYGTPGSESSAAHDLVAERFPAGSGDTISIVWQAADVTDPDIETRVSNLLARAAT